MATNDYALLQAANLRVNWDERNVQQVIWQVANVTRIEDARDLILALTFTGNMNADMLRNLISKSI